MDDLLRAFAGGGPGGGGGAPDIRFADAGGGPGGGPGLCIRTGPGVDDKTLIGWASADLLVGTL